MEKNLICQKTCDLAELVKLGELQKTALTDLTMIAKREAEHGTKCWMRYDGTRTTGLGSIEHEGEY